MAKSRTSSELELLVPLRRESGAEPLHRQLEDALRSAIRGGRLAPGAALPSSRALADQLDVSRGIVVGAYEQLVAEGYLAARPGGATKVAATAVEPPPAPATPRAVELVPGVVQAFEIEFRSGRPDLSMLPRAAWLRSVRHALMESPSDRFRLSRRPRHPRVARGSGRLPEPGPRDGSVGRPDGHHGGFQPGHPAGGGCRHRDRAAPIRPRGPRPRRDPGDDRDGRWRGRPDPGRRVRDARA